MPRHSDLGTWISLGIRILDFVIPRRNRSNKSGRTTPGMEAGTMKDDMFEVFRSGDADTLAGAPVWSYNAKEGLKPPAVAAVEKFRKAIEEAEKAAAQKQQQSQKQVQKKNP